jgi:hypothetical protein
LRLFAFALGLSCALLYIPETRDVAGMPAFLAWLMVNRR